MLLIIVFHLLWFCRLQDKLPVVRSISLPGQTVAEISAQVDLETKTVKELVTLDIWQNKVAVYTATF
jgi:hypothetical protein